MRYWIKDKTGKYLKQKKYITLNVNGVQGAHRIPFISVKLVRVDLELWNRLRILNAFWNLKQSGKDRE